MKLSIIKHRNLWFLVSGLLVVLSCVSLAVFPLRFGIDFTGGTLLEVEFGAATPPTGDIGAVLADQGYKEAVVQPVGTNGAIVRLPSVDEAAHQQLLAAFGEKFGEVKERRFDSIGPTIGAELRRSALWSLAIVLFAIAAYISYAFRQVSRPVASWKYGLVTLLTALFHDVLLPLGVFAALGHYFLIEINSGFVAAILTVLGFSVHDTIVVFDRIRENLIKSGGSFEEIVERSVNETLGRSINTTLSTLFPLLAIYVWGGASLKYFALVLIIGLTAGTYSSIFLASPMLVVLQKKAER